MDSSRALWAKFEKSGKLSDYLSFCEARRRQNGFSKERNEDGEKAGPSHENDQSSL